MIPKCFLYEWGQCTTTMVNPREDLTLSGKLFIDNLTLVYTVLYNYSKSVGWFQIFMSRTLVWNYLLPVICSETYVFGLREYWLTDCATIGNYRLSMQQSTRYRFYNDVIMSVDRVTVHSFRFFNDNFQRNMLLQPKSIHKWHASPMARFTHFTVVP
jgi:hypothetical protein